MAAQHNRDDAVIDAFGQEWSAFDQTALGEQEYRELFHRYFHIFPWDELPANAEGFDLGCGSGRWAAGVAPRVELLHCIDPSDQALDVARERLRAYGNARLHAKSVDEMPMPDGSQDFGYSLGVLHHVPETARALQSCVRKLKPGAPFLLYLYYRFDNRPRWFIALWQISDVARRIISRAPFGFRKAMTDAIASSIYWPLARIARMAEKSGADVSQFPLAAYRHLSFYSMRTDALDRFGTRLEQRFTREEMQRMMEEAGLEQIRFSETQPFWVAVGRKRAGGS